MQAALKDALAELDAGRGQAPATGDGWHSTRSAVLVVTGLVGVLAVILGVAWGRRDRPKNTARPLDERLTLVQGDGQLTNELSISLSGRLAPDTTPATVTVQGQPCPVGAAGLFRSAPVALVVGPNTIVVQAKTATGERATRTITVVVDRTPPELHVGDVPTTTALPDVAIRGRVQADTVEITVNGSRATLEGSVFSFQAILPHLGPNPVKVVARDRAGNASSSTLTITKVKPEVTIQIEQPAKAAHLSTREVVVSGHREGERPEPIDCGSSLTGRRRR